MNMKLIKKLTIAIVVAMPLFFCGCPGASYVDNEPNAPKGYVVQMENDYSDNVMVYMSASEVDTFFTAENLFSDSKHTTKLINDYYQINGAFYDRVAYTSIRLGEWNDSTKENYEPIADYVIETNPFISVYAYYENYTTQNLVDIIRNGKLNTLEKLK